MHVFSDGMGTVTGLLVWLAVFGVFSARRRPDAGNVAQSAGSGARTPPLHPGHPFPYTASREDTCQKSSITMRGSTRLP